MESDLCRTGIHFCYGLEKHMNHVNTLQPLTPDAMILRHNNIHKLAERTRLGIPVTLATDPRHSVPNAPGARIFSPFYSKWCSTLRLTATSNTQLVRGHGDIARKKSGLGYLKSALQIWGWPWIPVKKTCSGFAT